MTKKYQFRNLITKKSVKTHNWSQDIHALVPRVLSMEYLAEIPLVKLEGIIENFFMRTASMSW